MNEHPMSIEIRRLEAEIEGLKAEWHAEIERSKRYAQGYEKIIELRDSEIERLKVFESRYREEYEIVKRIWELIGFDEYNSKGSPEKSIFDYIQGYKDLLARAADALEGYRVAYSIYGRDDPLHLTQELRKAGE